MDAEVWSNADIRNGQRLFSILVTLILFKEAAVIGGLFLGQPWAVLLGPPGRLAPDLTPATQNACALALTLVLLLIAYLGRTWALIGLAMTYLAASGATLVDLMPELSAGAGEKGMLPLGIAAANAVLGLLMGAMALLRPELRAFVWSRATRRLVTPLPDDESPLRRPWRKHRTLGESVIALGRWVVNAVLVVVVLAVALRVYGLSDALEHLLERFFGHGGP